MSQIPSPIFIFLSPKPHLALFLTLHFYRQRYTSIFESGSIPTLNELRSQGLSGQLASSDAPLRSIYWQLYFSHLPLQDPSSWPILLTRQRSDYSQNRRKRLRAPDGSYPPETGLTQDQDLGFNSANTATSLNRAGTVVKDLRVNNPLSLDEEVSSESDSERGSRTEI